MDVARSHCRLCDRDIPADQLLCLKCRQHAPRDSRHGGTALLIGIAGAGALFVGVLGLNPRLCFIGGALSVVAVIFKLVQVLR